ncbi:MAG: peptidylprolyl isomerase [Clostridiales bacterium]|nr:peptidylprolyl isomerase [Clostridiales bacterium]
MKKWMTMVLCLLMALLLCPCAAETDVVQQYEAIGQEIAEVEAQIAALEEQLTALKRQQADVAAQALAAQGKVIVQIEVAGYGVIVAELYPEAAPITVANFVKLAGEGFYDGLTFHRIIAGFMIQGGDPNGNGTGGSPDKIKGEFSANGVDNPIAHERGVLSMARSSAPDSASSQFFIMHEAAPHLDGSYAAFGRVVAGMEVVDAICAQTPVMDWNGTVAAADQPVITTIRVVK